MRATRKDPPEKILADLAKKYPQLLNLSAPQRNDRLQQDDRSYTDMGVDALRALSQPLNYMREVGKGNYLPTQAELEGSGVSAMEGVAALANPFDHVYATLAMAGVIDDPNYDNEYSSAALLGLVTGSAGEKVPKALEKTVKLLREEGVKSYRDILPALRKNKDSEVIKELGKLKDKAIDFSKHIQKFGHEAYSQAKSSAPQGLSTWGTGGNAVNAALNFMIESEPDALMKFTPEKFDAGAFDANMQKFADQYLTGFRSVKAKNEANALNYITNSIGTGHGGMNLGPGLYHGTRSSQISGTDGTARPDYGPHLGVIRIAPDIGITGSSASQIIKDLQKYEFLGDTQGTYDLRHGLHKKGVYPGFKTSQEIRVSRSGTPVNLLDYANTPEGRKNLFNSYNPDYYGAEYNPNKPRGLDLLPPDYSKGGVMGMRPIKKRNRLMEMLDARRARRAKGGDQVINTSNTFTSELEPDDPLFQEIVQAQGPYPIGAAEVVGTPTQYEEADLAGSVLRGGALATREALGLVPVVGEALDLAELNQIVRTGKDFYEDEADPKMYAGMTAAGMLLPNIIERPAKAIGRGVKKFFKLSDNKDVKEQAFQNFKTAHAKSDFVKDVTDLVANRGLGYRRFVLKEGDRIVREINTPEGRSRIAEQIKLERAKAGKEAFTDWEMDQVVDYKISQVQGAVDNSFNVRSRMNLPLRNASYIKFGEGWAPPLSGPIAETAQNAVESTNRNFRYVYPDGISPEDKQKWNALYKKMGTGESLSSLNDGASGSATLGIGSKGTATLEHELFHAFQDRTSTPLDSEIYEALKDIRKKTNKFSDLDERGRRTAEYMYDFNRREPGAHLVETRDQLIQLGIISNRHDKITPDMLEKAYQMTKNNPYTSQIASAEKPRVINMISDESLRSDFFKQIAPLMNKLPAVAAVGVGVGLATDGSSKDYSKGGVMAMRKKKKGMSPIRK